MMDLDDFKSVNDKYGHKEGDTVLKELSDMLTQVIGDFDSEASIGRWGGEEFMVLLPNSDRGTAAELAERLRREFSRIEFPEAKTQTMSLGVTEMKPDEESDRACMRVDDALYQAKAAGKNKVVVL